MCDCCASVLALIYDEVLVYVEENRLVAEYKDTGYGDIKNITEINYCPMCGRKLREK